VRCRRRLQSEGRSCNRKDSRKLPNSRRTQLRKDDDKRDNDLDYVQFRPIKHNDRQTYNDRQIDTRQIEPMKIDHYRPRRCYKCRETGHLSRNCPQDRSRKQTRPVNRQENRPRYSSNHSYQNDNRQRFSRSQRSQPPQQMHAVNNKPQNNDTQSQRPQNNYICWHCNQPGHTKRYCPQLSNQSPQQLN